MGLVFLCHKPNGSIKCLTAIGRERISLECKKKERRKSSSLFNLKSARVLVRYFVIYIYIHIDFVYIYTSFFLSFPVSLSLSICISTVKVVFYTTTPLRPPDDQIVRWGWLRPFTFPNAKLIWFSTSPFLKPAALLQGNFWLH